MTSAGQLPTDIASTAVTGEPSVGSVPSVNVSELLHKGVDINVNTVSVSVSTAEATAADEAEDVDKVVVPGAITVAPPSARADGPTTGTCLPASDSAPIPFQ